MSASSGLLNVFNNGTEHVIAESAEAAHAPLVENYGCDPSEVEPFVECVDLDKVLRIEHEDYEDIAAFTLREWIEKEGRGLLSSTEF